MILTLVLGYFFLSNLEQGHLQKQTYGKGAHLTKQLINSFETKGRIFS